MVTKSKSKTDYHKGEKFHTRLLPNMAKELVATANRERRSYANMIEVLIEEALVQRGLERVDRKAREM